jgi:hypothetical protein
MTELVFVRGSSIRRVFINGRTISFMTAELGNAPLTIDLNKLEEEETKKTIKKAKIDKETLKELSLLQTEKDIIKDVTIDFQRTGWRLFKRK